MAKAPNKKKKAAKSSSKRKPATKGTKARKPAAAVTITDLKRSLRLASGWSRSRRMLASMSPGNSRALSNACAVGGTTLSATPASRRVTVRVVRTIGLVA